MSAHLWKKSSQPPGVQQDFGHRSHTPDILECIANLSNDEVFTPPDVVKDMLDLLPPGVWTNKDLRWLDIGCKTGVFLRETAKRLYDGLATVLPDPQARINHILGNMLYGIAPTHLTALISRRTLYSATDASSRFSSARNVPNISKDGNIRFAQSAHRFSGGSCEVCGAQSSIDRDGMDNYAYEFIHTPDPTKLFLNKEGAAMKFDVIIGNPPYQMADGGYGAAAKPLYHLFVEAALKLNPEYISLIIPARWYAGGKGLDDFRKEMIQDRRLKNIVDIPNASEVFPDVEIKGGVMYYLWDASYEGDCHWVSVRDGVQKSGSQRDLRAAGDVILRSDEACSIFSKVRSMHDGSWMNDEVSASKPFGLRTYVRSNSKKSSNTIKLYQNGGIGYINRDKITKNPDWIDLYKVLIPKAGGDGMKVLPNPVSGKPIVAEKNTACTETYLVAGVFEAKETAQRRAAYMKTKFFRYMLSLRKITQDNTAKVFSFVPVMEPDTDWTDKKLYNHFELTPEEIAHIEATVKEMP